jgi:hypothetical protein
MESHVEGVLLMEMAPKVDIGAGEALSWGWSSSARQCANVKVTLCLGAKERSQARLFL